MIYLQPENKSSLGEDTFWTWFDREVQESSFILPNKINSEDRILQYATLGPCSYGDNTVALLWELYPEMAKQLGSKEWNRQIQKMIECYKQSRYTVVATPFMLEWFPKATVLPIGVDINLFKLLDNKQELRKKYNIPNDKQIIFWMGTLHKMKGFDLLLEHRKINPNNHYIIVWKRKGKGITFKDTTTRFNISQVELCELMNCADLYLCTNRLRPYAMIDYEVMACNIPFEIIGYPYKDFGLSQNPREDLFRRGWNREEVLKQWLAFLH